MAINNDDIKISPQEEQAIKDNDPTNIPIDATNQGWTGDQVRAQIAASITANEGSVLSELKEKTGLIADKFDEVDADMTSRDNDVDTLQTDVTNLENEVDTKVNRSGDTMTGNLNMDNNTITNVNRANDTSFGAGAEDTDAVRYTELAEVLGLTTGSAPYDDDLATKFSSTYTKKADLDLNYIQTDGENAMSADFNVGGNDIVSVGLVDGVDVSTLKTTTDNHIANTTNPHSVTATQTGAYTTEQADTLLNNKVNKTTTIAGIDLQDNITLEELKSAIGNATETLDGLLSSEDKITINTLTDLLTNDDGDSLVNTLQEILDIFAQYPEGTTIVEALAAKANNTDIGNRTYTEQNVVTNEETITASIDAIDIDLNNIKTGALDNRYYTETELDPEAAEGSNVLDFRYYTITDLLTNGVLDARYYTESELNDGQLDTRYYTENETDNLLNGKINLDGTNSALSILNFVNGTTANVTYNSDAQVLEVATPDGTTLQVGGELWFANGKASGTIANGDLVQFAGVQGDHYLLKTAVTSEINANPDLFVGIATHGALDTEWVKSTWFGEVYDVSTNGWNVGDILYFDNVNGGLTNVEPTTKPIIQVAAVTKVETAPSANNGRLLVRPQFISRDAVEIFVADTNGKLTSSVLEGVLEELYDKTQAHEDLTNNPHSVTATQTGAYSTTETDNLLDTKSDVGHGHAISDTTGLQDALDNKVDTSLVGSSNGVASLDSSGKIPINQIPLQFDDVLQGYFNVVDGEFYQEATFENLIVGGNSEGKLYIDIDSNSIYRFEGSAYAPVITVDEITYGTIAGTAYEGNNGQANADAISALQTTVGTNTSDIGTNATAISNIEDGTTLVTKAEQDQNGNVIDTTYATKTELANATIDTLEEIGDVTVGATANQFLQRNAGDTAWQGKSLSKSDVGLNLVENYGIAEEANAQVGTSNTLYMTPLRTAQAISALAPQPNNATITMSAGAGLTGGGNFTTDQNTNETITLTHADTSSQASVDNSSNRDVIKSILVDTYGHITSITSDIVEAVTVSTTEPASPQEGDLWFDSTELVLYIYYNDGQSLQWVSVNEGAVAPAVSTIENSNPSSGETDIGVYYDNYPQIIFDTRNYYFSNYITQEQNYSYSSSLPSNWENNIIIEVDGEIVWSLGQGGLNTGWLSTQTGGYIRVINNNLDGTEFHFFNSRVDVVRLGTDVFNMKIKVYIPNSNVLGKIIAYPGM